MRSRAGPAIELRFGRGPFLRLVPVSGNDNWWVHMNFKSLLLLVLLILGACSSPAREPASDPEATTEPASDPETEAAPEAQAAAPSERKAYVFGLREGEIRLLRPPADGEVVIQVDPVNTGTERFVFGNQLLVPRYEIPLHTHENEDEVIFVHTGHGKVILEDKEVEFEPGMTVYIPPGVVHGVTNTTDEESRLVFVVSPPGLEEYFRDISVLPGEKREPMTPQQSQEIREKHRARPKVD